MIGFQKITSHTIFAIILYAVLGVSCRSPEVKLRDNRLEPLVVNAFATKQSDFDAALSRKTQTIDDLLLLAMDRSEKIGLSSEDVYQAREKTREAWGAILPQVSFRMGIYGPDTTGYSGGTYLSSGFRFYARQPLLTGLDEIAALQAVKSNEELSQRLFESQTILLYDQIAAVFYQYLMIEEALRGEETLLSNTLGIKKELEKRLRLGKIRRSEILSTEVLIAKTEARIATIKDTLKGVQAEVRKLTGLERDFTPETVNIDEISPTVNELASPELTEKAVDRRPDIEAMRLQWQLARHETLRAAGGHVPRIYLEGSYRLPESSSSEGDYYAGLVAEVPLFSGGQVHSRFLSAQSRERQAKLRYDESLRYARETIRYSLESWEYGSRILAMQGAAWEKAKKNYEAILADYRLGQATNLELLSALNDETNAGMEYRRTIINRKLSWTRIQILLGNLPVRSSKNETSKESNDSNFKEVK